MGRPLAERDWPDPAVLVGGAAVDFRLTYRGPLPASQPKDSRSGEKHDIRLNLSPQLAALWDTEPVLREYGLALANANLENRRVSLIQLEENTKPHYQVATCGYLAIPLVTRHNGLACHLDIEILRREDPGGILHDGDIDNRLKTLFDALHMPLADNEVPGLKWGSGGTKLYCLLEDDSLITKLSVDTHKLLRPKHQSESDGDVELTIAVSVKVLTAKPFTRWGW
jgi:hypothetical protein